MLQTQLVLRFLEIIGTIGARRAYNYFAGAKSHEIE